MPNYYHDYPPEYDYPDPPEPTICNTCNGNGILTDSKWGEAIGNNCHICGGTGAIDLSQCSECKGKKYVVYIEPYNEGDEAIQVCECETCKGKGYEEDFYSFDNSDDFFDPDDYDWPIVSRNYPRTIHTLFP